MHKVSIVDYGAGNLASVERAVSYLGGEPIRVSDPDKLYNAERIILPGVGAARYALKSLKRNYIDQALTESVLCKSTPFLGICLGMQIIADTLFEFGESHGLGWIPGRVVYLGNVVQDEIIVPHMGWSDVMFNEKGRYFQDPKSSKAYYFCHSYTFVAKNSKHVAAHFDYSENLVAAITCDTIFATQFHPEKSQSAGLNIIKRFLKWSP